MEFNNFSLFLSYEIRTEVFQVFVFGIKSDFVNFQLFRRFSCISLSTSIKLPKSFGDLALLFEYLTLLNHKFFLLKSNLIFNSNTYTR